jgi:hypothetical protein
MDKIINAERVIGTAGENRDHSKLSEYFSVSIPQNPSWDLCHALIIGSTYTNFPSFGALKGYSKKILLDASNPFLAISPTHTEKIDEVYKIRNYLSHYSKASSRSLMHVYSTKYSMQRFLEPGQFLLAYDAQRLWGYFDGFAGASNDMKAWY